MKLSKITSLIVIRAGKLTDEPPSDCQQSARRYRLVFEQVHELEGVHVHEAHVRQLQ